MSTSRTLKPRAVRPKQLRGLTLDVIRGPLVGSSSSVIRKEGSNFRIGRTKASKLQIKDETVSEKHGELRWSARKGWEIRDLGSSNGTSVNGEALAEGVWRVVETGDEVRIGETTVVRLAFWEGKADDVPASGADEGSDDPAAHSQGRKRVKRAVGGISDGGVKVEDPVDCMNGEKENATAKTQLVVGGGKNGATKASKAAKEAKAAKEMTAGNKTVLEHIEAHCAMLERELVEQGAEAARRLREAWEAEKRRILDSVRP